MKKFLIFLVSFFLFSAFIIPSRSHAAVSCKVELDPPITTTDTTSIKTVTIFANGIDESKTYSIKIGGGVGAGIPYGTIILNNQKFSGGQIVFSNMNARGIPETSTGGSFTYMPGSMGGTVPFLPGNYVIEVIESKLPISFFGAGETQICRTSFNVDKGPGTKCNMIFPQAKIEESTDLKIQLTGLGDPKANYITYLQKDSDKGDTQTSICKSVAEYGDPKGVSLGILPKGIYFVSVFPTANCSAVSTTVTAFATSFLSASGYANKSCTGLVMMPGLAIGTGSPNAATLSGFLTFTGTIGSPCKDMRVNPSDKPNFECQTAIGAIQTSPTAFAKQIFGILLSLSGGIALLLIINAGYQIMVSEGNPEKIQGARETITSAIIGLVFIIFSLTILQIIGVDILRIPGFTR